MSNIYLETYKDIILSIKRGKSKNFVSNAKPVFLITLIDATDRCILTSNCIYFCHEDLSKLYMQLAEKFSIAKVSPYNIPFYHLSSEPFYHLVWRDAPKGDERFHTPSAKYLREHLLYAKFDDELWDLLQNRENREYLRNSIISHFLTE